jgi:hypothetical protein
MHLLVIRVSFNIKFIISILSMIKIAPNRRYVMANELP